MSDTRKTDVDEMPLRRFWKSRRDLPTVMWDPIKNKAKFEFVRGVLDTRDPALADELIELGYQEVELDVGESVKPPLEDMYVMPESMPTKSRRVLQGHENDPPYRPVNRKAEGPDPQKAAKLTVPRIVPSPKAVSD